MKLRFALIILLSTTLISGCSTVNKTFDSIGGLFSKKGDKCTGPDCEEPSLIDNQQTAKKWHCYGQKGSEDWQCQTEADETKIESIQPETRAPRQVDASQATTQPPQLSSTSSPIPATTPNTISCGASAPDSMTLAQPVTPQSGAKAEEGEPGNQNNSLLNQPASYYTIQLIALPEQAEVLEYATANGITTPLTARINSQGIPWHVLLLGIYPDKSAAEQAESEWVAARNLKVKPWIRQLGPLQDAMREATEG